MLSPSGWRENRVANSSVLVDKKISEDNQKLRPGCPSDYQIFCERIDPKMFIPNNSSKLSFFYQ